MFGLTDISSIRIKDNRQRREFDPAAILALAESIKSKGLMHPPVMRVTADGIELVAGERRLRAMQSLWEMGFQFSFQGTQLPAGKVPYTNIGNLNGLELEEAEYEENVIRVDLSWQERAEAESRLHDLRSRQAAAAGAPPQTIAKTAEEIYGTGVGSTADKVSKSVILAKHLDKPEVAAAKSLKEAMKVLRALEQKENNAALTASVGARFSSSDHTLLNASCLDFMRDYSGRGFDVILTDPPYGMNADSFGTAGGALTADTHDYDDSPEAFQALIEAWAPLTFKVAAAQAHLYAFCDIDGFKFLRDQLALSGWRVHRTPIIWTKPHAHRVPWPEHGPRRQWEMCVYAVKGDKRVNSIMSDVIEVAVDANLGIAAQKPVALYRELLKRSIKPGDTVLDTFAGSGPIFPAATELLVTATGIELSPETYAIAVKRLAALKNGPEDMFASLGL